MQLRIPQYLYPPLFENASRLSFYASFFNSIELNSSFYKIPKIGTVIKWSDSVPEKFKFTFKLWKGITHIKGLHFSEEDVFAFFKSIGGVQDKTGCVLLQFPPSLSLNYIKELDKLLSCIEKADPLHIWKIAVEFREKSWYHQSVYDLLDKYKVSIVIHDMPKSATPFLKQKTDFIYVRFHGPTGNYRESYPDDFLNEYALYIKEWMQDGKTVFVYFNNTMGNATDNLNFLNISLRELPKI